MSDELLDLPGVVVLRAGEHELASILAALPGASRLSALGTLYFEPGMHRFPGSVVFPKGVELIFPPGASLELLSGERVTILGALQAGLTRIFSLPATAPQPVVVLGTLEAGSSAVTEVYPEWFGAGPAAIPNPQGLAPPQRDDDALEAALDTAWRQRVLAGLPPLPVVLAGSYGLSRTLSVRALEGPGPFLVEGLVLRGRHGGSSGTGGHAPTLYCRDGFSERAMLLLEDVLGATVENISLDAMGRAEVCVEVMPGAFFDQAQSPLDILFSGCLFTGATDRQVGILARLQSRQLPSPGEAGVISLAGCQIEVRPTGRDRDAAAGVVLEGVLPCLVRLVHCVFEGTARWMVGAAGGSLFVKACQFWNRQQGSSDRWVGGVDVLLVSTLPSSAVRVPVPSLTMVHCRSVSDRFLCVLPHDQLGESFDGAFPLTAGILRSLSLTVRVSDANIVTDALLLGAPQAVTLVQVEHDPERLGATATGAIPLLYSVKVGLGPGTSYDCRVTLVGCRFLSGFALAPEVGVYSVDADTNLAGLVPAAQVARVR